MNFLIKLLILTVIYDDVVLGLISLHNGRIVNKRLVARNNNNSGKNDTSTSRRAEFILRPKRRDASVFRLKFLDGTDMDAFEFVNPGSGWGIAASHHNNVKSADRSPTIGPTDYVEPIGDGDDYESNAEDEGHGSTLSPTVVPTVPTTPVFTRQVSFSSQSSSSELSASLSSTKSADGLLMISAEDETDLLPVVSNEKSSSIIFTRTTTTTTTQATTTTTQSSSNDVDDYEISQPIDGGHDEGGVVVPHFENGDDEEDDDGALSYNQVGISSTTTADTRGELLTPVRKTTFLPAICNDTLLAETSTTTSLEPSSTTMSSTSTPSTTVNPCVTPIIVNDSMANNGSASSTASVITSASITFVTPTNLDIFDSSKNLSSFSNAATTTGVFSTLLVAEKANNSNFNQSLELSTVVNAVNNSVTLIYDGTNSAEVVDALNNSTSRLTAETSSVVPITTAQIVDGSGNPVTSEGSSNETTTKSSNLTASTAPLKTNATRMSMENITHNVSTISVGNDNLTTTQSPVNATSIPFGNLNVAKVRMSVHVTSAFTRKQLEKLLQQGLQSALISALNRNTRIDDTLFELKRIIRMAGPIVEIFGISIPTKNETPKSTVTHLNVTFGAVLPLSPHHSGEYINFTQKSHYLKRRTLPGRHVRDIMLSVTPIELSAAAGIPIEGIRPVSENDYDIIIDNWYDNSTAADQGRDEHGEEHRSEELVLPEKLPDWVLPVVIVTVAFVLVLVYVVVTGICVLKGYRLRLEKVGSLAATSPDGGDGSYAEGAARLAEVVSSPPNRSPPSGFAVKPLAPVSQILLPPESGSPNTATKPQLELRRWTLDGTQDERVLNKLQQQALSVDIATVSSGVEKKTAMGGKMLVAVPAHEATCDKSINTSTVALHSMATATEGPEFVNRATSATHQQSRTVGTSSTQFQTDQSTDTTVDIGQKMKSVQTTTTTSSSAVENNGTTPESNFSVAVAIEGETISRNNLITKLPTPGKDNRKRRSRRRRDKSHDDGGDGNEHGKLHNASRQNSEKAGMTNNQETTGAGAASGILLHPLELRYDTIYLRQNEKADAKQVDTPFKLVKLVPGVDVKEQLVQTVQPVSLEDAKKIDDEMKDSKKRSSLKGNKEKSADKTKEGEQLKTLLDTVEGIVRKYTVRNEGDETKLKADVNECLQQTMQRDINYIKPRAKVGRNMRAVSPESSPKAPPMLASFEAALRLRVADETISEERVKRQYQIPLVQNTAGNASILARHLLERGKIGCLPEM